MDSQKRMLIALGLSFALTLLYMTFFAPKGQQGQMAPPPRAAIEAPDAGAPVTPPAAAAVPLEPAPTAQSPAREANRDFSLVHYLFSSRGGGLLRAELEGQKMHEQVHVSFGEGLAQLVTGKEPARPQMQMAIPVPGQPLPLAVSIAGPQPLSESINYSISDGEKQIRLVGSQSGWEVSKTIEWSPDGVQFLYTIAVKNAGSQPAAGELGIHYARAVDAANEEKPSFFGGVGNLSGAACRVGEDLKKVLPDDKPPSEHRGPIAFFGIDQQYFLAALFPVDGTREGRCVLTATATARSVSAYFPIQVMPGQSVTYRFGAYLGPKEMDALTNAPSKIPGVQASSISSPHLEKTVDFGIWAFICNVLLVILKFFYRITGNWGVAIIGLTVVVKVALMPLTHKAMVSGEAMKKLQPKIEELRKKFAEDKERQNLETMKLYQEAKVNPLGGCLPMLVQMPVWIALFTTLRNSYEIYGEPFIRPVWTDLTYKDPTYVLPLLLCITMIVTQKLQPQMMDATQAKVMTYVMPVFFTAIILNYPAGLSLYIFTNNVLSIGQQYGLRKYLEKKGIAQKVERKEKKDERQRSSLSGKRASR